QIDLDPAQATVVLGDRICVAERGDERPVAIRGMSRPADPQQRSQRQDDRDLVLGHLTPARRAGNLMVVAAVPAHDPRERGVRRTLGLREAHGPTLTTPISQDRFTGPQKRLSSEAGRLSPSTKYSSGGMVTGCRKVQSGS